MARRSRVGEVVCTCDAYKYPHRQFGGNCDVHYWVVRFFSPTRSACDGCLCRDGAECEVVTGREQPAHCPEWRAYVRYEEMKLYGKAARLLARAQGK